MNRIDKKKTATKKTASKLGHDPLAWIDESEAEPETTAMSGSVEDDNQSISTINEINAAAKDTSVADSVQAVSDSMPVKNTEISNSTLSLPAYFGIAQSSDVCGEMRKILSSGTKKVEIAGGEVETFDAAALQLLMAFNKQAATSGIDVNWSERSQKINEVSVLLNINI